MHHLYISVLQGGSPSISWSTLGEYGLLGLFLLIASAIIRYMYKSREIEMKELIKDMKLQIATLTIQVQSLNDKISHIQEDHKSELLDILQQQHASNASVREQIQNTSITDKAAITSIIATEMQKVGQSIILQINKKD